MARNIVRRSGGFVRGRSSGRLTEWFGTQFAGDVVDLPAASGIIALSLTAAELAKRPFTITRTVGLLAVRSDQAVAEEAPFGAMGGIVVSDKALALGFTAVPDPVTQSSSDEWFLYQNFIADGAASTNVGQRISQYQFDSRAQRKVQDGEDIAFVVANSSAADGCRFLLVLRLLVKLS